MCCCCFSPMAVGAYFVQGGISSLMLRSADVLPKGQRMLDLSASLDSYASTGLAKDKDAYMLPGLAYGLKENLSLGVTMPVIVIDAETIGLRAINAIAKYRLGGSRDDGVAVSLSSFANIFSSGSDAGLGSGELGYGLMMNISLYGDATTLHLSLGGEKSDLKNASLASGYSSEQQLIVAGGIEFRPQQRWQYLLEGVFTRTNAEDDNFLLIPGVRYTPDKRMSFYSGVALGLPSKTSMPEWRITAGVSVSLGRDKPAKSSGAAVTVTEENQDAAQPSIDEAVPTETEANEPVSHWPAGKGNRLAAQRLADGTAMQALPSTTAIPISAIDAHMLQQIEALRSEIGALISAPPTVIARVEIQNASGIRGLGETVAKLLVRKGYSVVSISDISRPINRPSKVFYMAGLKNAEIIYVDRARLGVRKQTRIYFIEGFQQRATRVSLALPGSQRVMSDVDLINVAEIRLVIGKDMKALLKRRPIKRPAT